MHCYCHSTPRKPDSQGSNSRQPLIVQPKVLLKLDANAAARHKVVACGMPLYGEHLLTPTTFIDQHVRCQEHAAEAALGEVVQLADQLKECPERRCPEAHSLRLAH